MYAEQNRATNNKHRPTDGRERRKKSLNQVNKLSIFDKLFTQHFTREREICIVYGSDQLRANEHKRQAKTYGKTKT